MAYISFMIPVYNGEELIRDSIESVLSQPEQDWNLVIMDDGSSDSTREICCGYAEKDERIKVITHKNTGLGKNRNLGFPYLEGSTWTIFLDHDDLLVKDFYNENFKAFLEKCRNKDVEVIVPSRIRADYDLNMAVVDEMNDFGYVEGGNKYAWNAKYEFASMIYSTDLLMRNNIRFFETRPEMESIFRHMTIFLSKKVLYTNRVCFSVRRENRNSISNTWNYLDIIPIRFDAYLKLLKWHIDRKDDDAAMTCKEYLRNIFSGYFVESVEKYGIGHIYDALNRSDFLNNSFEVLNDILTEREINRFRNMQKFAPLFWVAMKIKSVKNRLIAWGKRNGSEETRTELTKLQKSISYDSEWLNDVCEKYEL